VDNNLFVMSGRSAVRGSQLGDIWQLDTEVMRWVEVEQRGSVSPWTGATSAAVDGVESLEGACSATVGRCIYVFGGKRGTKTNDTMYRFDTRAGEWSVVTQTGDVPTPRTRAACAADPADATQWYMFGGACDEGKSAQLYRLNLPG
jgi:hypothetical protein